MSTSAAELERGWRLAEARGTAEAGAVSADPLEWLVRGKPIMTGVDASGTRHLLIPSAGDASVVTDVAGRAIVIRLRTLLVDGTEEEFVDLACLRPDLFDEFAVLSADVVDAVVGAPERPLEAAADVVRAWRELLRAISAPRLDRGGIIGLFAELRILDRLITLDPRHALATWTGPSRARHDFQRGNVVVEVKGSTARRGRPLTVHGIDQLEAPPLTTLYLAWVALEVAVGRGESLRAIVDRLMNETLDPSTLERQLTNAGYDFPNSEMYESPCFSELELRWYAVDEQFPRLTRDHLIARELPHGVIAVSYDVDLSGDHPPALTEPEAERVLRTLAAGI